MNERVQLFIAFSEIKFINFLPKNCEEEKYFLEIKASIRNSRRTTPEMYDDFAKSVINEFFFVRELKKSKMMYVGLFQVHQGKERFLGDFELDLTPYYLESCEHDVHFDLRNYRELYVSPNYMPTDMRKKGWIDFKIKIQSKLQSFLADIKGSNEGG